MARVLVEQLPDSLSADDGVVRTAIADIRYSCGLDSGFRMVPTLLHAAMPGSMLIRFEGSPHRYSWCRSGLGG